MSYFEICLFEIIFYTNEYYKKLTNTFNYYTGKTKPQIKIHSVLNSNHFNFKYNIQKIVYNYDNSKRDIDIYQLCFLQWKYDSFVEIYYEYDNNDYIICVNEEQLYKIQFFTNDLEDLNNDNINIMDGILYAENIKNKKDITYLIKKYAGPNQDFYKSINLKYKKEWLPFDGDISIMNKMAETTIYKNGDSI
jgi:hypothetical protein